MNRHVPKRPIGAWPLYFFPSAYRKLRWAAMILAGRDRAEHPRCCICKRMDVRLILKHSREDRVWTVATFFYDLVSEREDWTYWRAVCRVCARTDNFFTLSGEKEPAHPRCALGTPRARKEKT